MVYLWSTSGLVVPQITKWFEHSNASVYTGKMLKSFKWMDVLMDGWMGWGWISERSYKCYEHRSTVLIIKCFIPIDIVWHLTINMQWRKMTRKMTTDHCRCSGNGGLFRVPADQRYRDPKTRAAIFRVSRSFPHSQSRSFSSNSTSLALNFKCSGAGSRQHISRYKTWGPSETGKLLQIVFSLNFEWLSSLVASNHLFKS